MQRSHATVGAHSKQHRCRFCTRVGSVGAALSCLLARPLRVTLASRLEQVGDAGHTARRRRRVQRTLACHRVHSIHPRTPPQQQPHHTRRTGPGRHDQRRVALLVDGLDGVGQRLGVLALLQHRAHAARVVRRDGIHQPQEPRIWCARAHHRVGVRHGAHARLACGAGRNNGKVSWHLPRRARHTTAAAILAATRAAAGARVRNSCCFAASVRQRRLGGTGAAYCRHPPVVGAGVAAGGGGQSATHGGAQRVEPRHKLERVGRLQQQRRATRRDGEGVRPVLGPRVSSPLRHCAVGGGLAVRASAAACAACCAAILLAPDVIPPIRHPLPLRLYSRLRPPLPLRLAHVHRRHVRHRQMELIEAAAAGVAAPDERRAVGRQLKPAPPRRSGACPTVRPQPPFHGPVLGRGAPSRQCTRQLAACCSRRRCFPSSHATAYTRRERRRAGPTAMYARCGSHGDDITLA
mmetsp:Transcript_9411/g.33091  ORF Transcript_9411/g.33091 Transcript_9411/m.33091 type:complete len:464 (+) Transcript_9411:2148-3539(+)